MEAETWKDVIGYEGIYMASSIGRIKKNSRIGCFGNLIQEHFRRPVINGRYTFINLNKHGVKKQYLLHRIIAMSFIPNPINKPEVNHIDGNKLNNNIENLEWCTSSENQKHAYKTGLQIGTWIGKTGKMHPVSKGVVKLSFDGVEIDRYDSVRDAANSINIDESYISRCCKNKNKTARGFYWGYSQAFMK